jgi:hypothetical protein
MLRQLHISRCLVNMLQKLALVHSPLKGICTENNSHGIGVFCVSDSYPIKEQYWYQHVNVNLISLSYPFLFPPLQSPLDYIPLLLCASPYPSINKRSFCFIHPRELNSTHKSSISLVWKLFFFRQYLILYEWIYTTFSLFIHVLNHLIKHVFIEIIKMTQLYIPVSMYTIINPTISLFIKSIFKC